MTTTEQAKQLVDLIIYLAKDATINTKPTYDDTIKIVNTILNQNIQVVNPKVYAVLVTQEGNTRPLVVVLKSDIDGIVWTRKSVGVYNATRVGAFPEFKTVPNNNPVSYYNEDNKATVTARRISNDAIEITTKNSDGELSDGLLTSLYIEFNVYL